jgi:hypothetical protein
LRLYRFEDSGRSEVQFVFARQAPEGRWDVQTFQFFSKQVSFTMKTRTAFLLAASIVGVFTMCNTAPGTKSRAKLGKEDVEKIMQSVSNWGRWGAEDQLGTLNLITPEKRKQAAGLVEEGKPVSLSHNVIKKKWQGSPPFVHKMLGTGQSPDAVSVSDEYSVQYHGFNQTHMDSLAHLFHQGKMYNGVPQQTVTEEGAQKL